MNKQNLQFDANARSATSKNIMKTQQIRPTKRATNLKRKYLPSRYYYCPTATTTDNYYKGHNQLVSFDRQTIASIQPKARIQFGTGESKGKRERQQDDGGLLISTRSNTNEMDIQHYHQSIQHSNSRRLISKQKTTTKRREQSPRLFALVLSLSLTCIHNASPSSSFGDFERHYYPDILGNNYPVQLNEQQLLFAQQQSPNHRHQQQQQQQQWVRMTRSFADPLMEIMSTPTGSFTQDPSSTISPPGAAQSGWTSIFGGFGGGGGNNNKPQQNPGGGGDSLDNHIKKILVPRISGTPGNVQVRNYIVDELQKNNYHVELDEFTGSTPVGDVKFANIIASSNPGACRQLVLACHYDSKMMEGFLGAIDSAVPCAMLLKMSETFNKSFRASSDFSTIGGGGGGESSKDSLGLRFIFFDGEEAYEQWTQTDSLYGSRHLAAKWAKQPAPSQCTQAGSSKTELDRIELFVLLDLIGTSDTSFVMYNARLKHHYDALQKYERDHLAKSGMSQLQARRAVSFKSRTIPLDFVEDDHVPFKKRGVPILLLLAHPFPKVWHTVADNYDAIDFPKTRRILNVLENFVSNYSAN